MEKKRIITALNPLASGFVSHSLRGRCCLEPLWSSVISYLCNLEENQPLKSLNSPICKMEQNTCSEETKGCFYSARHWEGLNVDAATSPRRGRGAGYQVSPLPRSQPWHDVTLSLRNTRGRCPELRHR